METFTTIENIPNDSNFVSNALSYRNNENLDEYIAKVIEFQAKYKTPDEIKKFNKHLAEIIIVYTKDNEKIRNEMDEIDIVIKKQEALNDKLKQFIDGTYQCIKVNIKEPVDIKLPIDTFSDTDIQKMRDKSIITSEIYQTEIHWRQIMKKYPSNENKISFIKIMDDKISKNKEKMINNMNTIFRNNIVKNKVNHFRNVFYSTNEIVNKYNIDISMPALGETIIMQHVENVPTMEASIEAQMVASIEAPMAAPIVPTIVEQIEMMQQEIAKPITITPQLPIANVIPQPQLPIANIIPQLPVSKPIANVMMPLPLLSELLNEKKHLSNIAPIDIFLEQICRYGQRCAHINNPLRCGRNHIVIGTPCYSGEIFTNKINKGDVIPQEFCKDEIIWDKSRCHNIYCTYLHGAGRIRYLDNFKSKSSNETYNNIERKRKQEDDISYVDVNTKKPSISSEPSPKQNPLREENKYPGYIPYPSSYPPPAPSYPQPALSYPQPALSFPPSSPAFSSYYYLYPNNGFQNKQ
jgi:hypothetical protein